MIGSALPFEVYQQLIKANSGMNLGKAKALEKKYMFAVCPFKVTMGTISTTESGYKPINAEPTDFTQFSRTGTGDEASVVEWVGSVKTDQAQSKLKRGIDRGIKEFQRGQVFYGVLVDEQLNADYSPYSANQNFITQTVTQKIRLRFYKIPENKDFFDNIFKYQYRFYTIPQSFVDQSVEQSGNPYDDQNRTFFYIEEDALQRNVGKEIIYYDLTFVNFAAKLKTGTKTSFYLQCGGPGEPYAFPKYFFTKEMFEPYVGLDYQRLKTLPVKYGQVLFYGNCIFHSIVFWGRPSVMNDTKLTMFPPRLIAPLEFRGSLPDKLTYRKQPEANFYLGAFAFNLIRSWDAIQAAKLLYDIYAKALITGGITAVNAATIADTNPAANRRSFWDDNFARNFKDAGTSGDVATTGNEYFQFVNSTKHIIKPEREISGTSLTKGYFDFAQIFNKDLSHWNFFTATFFKTMIEAPLTQTENIKVGLNRIPFIGRIGNFFTLGLSPGFSFRKTSSPIYPGITGLISAELYDYYNKVFINGKTNILPLNAFMDGSADNIGAITGTVGHSTGFAFGLTDKIVCHEFDDDGKQISTNTKITTDYINSPLPNGNRFMLNEETTLLPASSTVDYGDFTNKGGYILDGFNLAVTGEGEYQIKFYDNLGDGQNLSDEHCVYIARFRSRSSLNKMLRDFNNYEKLSSPLLSFQKPFEWPKTADPMPPYPDVPEFDVNIDDMTIALEKYSDELFTFEDGGIAKFITKDLNLNANAYQEQVITDYKGYHLKKASFNVSAKVYLAQTNSKGANLKFANHTLMVSGKYYESFDTDCLSSLDRIVIDLTKVAPNIYQGEIKIPVYPDAPQGFDESTPKHYKGPPYSFFGSLTYFQLIGNRDYVYAMLSTAPDSDPTNGRKYSNFEIWAFYYPKLGNKFQLYLKKLLSIPFNDYADNFLFQIVKQRNKQTMTYNIYPSPLKFQFKFKVALKMTNIVVTGKKDATINSNN